MITHFAEVTLATPSIQAVKQWYGGLLQLPFISEKAGEISFLVTPHCKLTFREAHAPVSPAHLAFEVPIDSFEASVGFLQRAGIPLLRWPDGREIDRFESGRNVYFRDGDGHLLELIAHEAIAAAVLRPSGPLPILYLREVGMPSADAPALREQLKQLLRMQTRAESDLFTFVIGGTAHAVVVSTERPWVPIAMKAMPPAMEITLGVSSLAALRGIARRGYEAQLRTLHLQEDGSLHLVLSGYPIRLIHTPNFPADLPARLGLPSAGGRLSDGGNAASARSN